MISVFLNTTVLQKIICRDNCCEGETVTAVKETETGASSELKDFNQKILMTQIL